MYNVCTMVRTTAAEPSGNIPSACRNPLGVSAVLAQALEVAVRGCLRSSAAHRYLSAQGEVVSAFTAIREQGLSPVLLGRLPAILFHSCSRTSKSQVKLIRSSLIQSLLRCFTVLFSAHARTVVERAQYWAAHLFGMTLRVL